MPTHKVLVVRNDKLGDFMLAWPAFALLKTSLPDCRIDALVPEYTRPLAVNCPWIDRVVVDPAEDPRGSALTRTLSDNAYDAIVTLFSTSRVGLAAWRAGIPVRIAPATKLAQIFYNQRLTQRRSRSEKPEFAYNVDLVKHLLNLWNRLPKPPAAPPYLQFGSEQIAAARADLLAQHGFDYHARLVFIHAGSGGSARNLSIPQYATLATRLASNDGNVFVLCAGPGELSRARELAASIAGCAHVVFDSREGLVNYARRIAFADLFISGSTGPLHIAGALNRPTAAFYPRRQSSTALRWQTINDASRRLAFSPSPHADDHDMSAIDLDRAAAAIIKIQRFLSSFKRTFGTS
ncbi:MAG: glycosyltransferase family 9 protein [Gammaproteobacteria bacterium]|nr:glycosyltransferase family 9 protein [Gammaproteobacteria bacterium]